MWKINQLLCRMELQKGNRICRRMIVFRKGTSKSIIMSIVMNMATAVAVVITMSMNMATAVAAAITMSITMNTGMSHAQPGPTHIL